MPKFMFVFANLLRKQRERCLSSLNFPGLWFKEVSFEIKLCIYLGYS